MKKVKSDAKSNKNNKTPVAKSNKQIKNTSNIRIQKKIKNKTADDKPHSQKLLHQIMPFVMYVISLFLIVAFVMIDLADNSDAMGVVGQGLHDIICGIFGVGAFFIPVITCGNFAF